MASGHAHADGGHLVIEVGHWCMGGKVGEFDDACEGRLMRVMGGTTGIKVE